MKRIFVVMAAATAALVFASTAFGSGLTCSHGSAPCQGTAGGGNGNGSAAGGTLPFTGLDLAGISALGLGLLGAGFALHRVGRRKSQT